MGVEYKATLGYGLLIEADQIRFADPERDTAWEVLEGVTLHRDGITYEFGGGGYSSTDEVYALLLKSTVTKLDDVDGAITLAHAKFTYEDGMQLADAYREATGKEAPGMNWLVIGGYH